ncbi:DUF6551 family protein [Brevundimonas sp.]|uniref:DUF6551 family protein n=1 Tax=Brevundimonas sp. TaxID=1871086 RepID=UPI0035B03278
MKRLVDLTESCCRWPVGPAPAIGQTQDQLWCAAPRAPGDLFCPEHMKRGCPGRKVRPENVRARNLVTIKLALMRLGSRGMTAETAHQNRPIPAARARAAAFGAAVAPKMGEISPIQPEGPARTGFEGGAEPVQTEGKYSDPIPTDGLRPIEPINSAGLAPTTPSTTGPIFEWVDPASLLVNETYQRDLSERSVKLIRRIIEGWNWTKFKPPVCSLGDHGLEVIDGQHTAIAAATHPHVAQIPVMIVETETVQDRASAFIGQNTTRLGITKMQLHRAAVAAGDEDALTIEQVCQRSGVRLLMAKPHRWKVGDSVAVQAVGALIDRRGAMGARKVMELLVRADAAPVTQAGLKAVEMILFDPEYADADQDHLHEAIRTMGEAAEREAATFAAAHRVALWKALGIVWFRKCRKQRKAA